MLFGNRSPSSPLSRFYPLLNATRDTYITSYLCAYALPFIDRSRSRRRLAAYCSCHEPHQPEKLFPDQICQRPNIDRWKASRVRVDARDTTGSPSFSSLSPAIDNRDLTCRDMTASKRTKEKRMLSFNMLQLSAHLPRSEYVPTMRLSQES